MALGQKKLKNGKYGPSLNHNHTWVLCIYKKIDHSNYVWQTSIDATDIANKPTFSKRYVEFITVGNPVSFR